MYWNDIYLCECHGAETHYPALTMRQQEETFSIYTIIIFYYHAMQLRAGYGHAEGGEAQSQTA